MWEIIMAQVIGIPVLIAAVAWLCKSIITYRLNKDMELFKNSLESKSEIHLEKLRNQLQLSAIEHEIKFRSIHEKQAEIIAETYALLFDVYKKVDSYTRTIEFSDEPDKKEKLELVRESYEKFRAFYYPRELYFSPKTGKKVRDLSNRLAGIASDFTHGMQREQALGDRARPADYKDYYWDKAEEAVRNDIPPLLESMAAEFREMLGVKDDSGADNGEKETSEETGQSREPEAQG